MIRTGPQSRSALSSGVVLAMLLTAGVHLALGRVHNHVLGADDDRLWLFFTGASLGRPAEADAWQDRVAASMRADGVAESDAMRIDLRRDYARNYVAASVVYRGAAEAVQRLDPAIQRDYPRYVAVALPAGFIAAYALTSALVLLAAWFCGSRRVAFAAGLAIVLSSFLEIAFDVAGDPIAGGPLLLPRAGERVVAPIQSFSTNTLAMIVNPGIAFTIFGDTPRNHFLLAAIAVFALRSAGRYRGAALLLLGLSFLHQSQTGLLFACLLACDLLLRPHIFAEPAMKAITVLTLAVFLARESLAPYIGLQRPVAAMVIALVLATTVALAAMRAAREPPARVARLARRLHGGSDRWADVRVLFALWAATVLPVAIANAFVGSTESLYFWAQVHGRLLAILRSGLLLAVAVAVIDWTRATERRSGR